MQKTYRKPKRKKRTWKDNVGLGIYFIKNYWMIILGIPSAIALTIMLQGIWTQLSQAIT